jgi:hypothetical protein
MLEPPTPPNPEHEDKFSDHRDRLEEREYEPERGWAGRGFRISDLIFGRCLTAKCAQGQVHVIEGGGRGTSEINLLLLFE